MPLKNFSCACSKCDHSIFNDGFFVSAPKTGRDVFCSPECLVKFYRQPEIVPSEEEEALKRVKSKKIKKQEKETRETN